ncbi:MAG: 3'-5' exonuclease [Candidatus Buchananbacteria bacterium]|nr:3'-5' exonuclease [Candidatus Buchananbacteria bacterium]
MHEKYLKFLETDFVVFDIETSGLDPLKDEILEIAAVKLRGRDTLATYEQLVRPTKAIPPEVAKINGLNEIFLLANGCPIKEMIPKFLEFIDGSIIVGHNIKEFDWLFVSTWIKKCGLQLPADVKFIDTLELSRKLLRLPKYNLGAVGAHYGHKIENAHRALPDTEFNAKVFIELMEQLLNPKPVETESVGIV